MTEYKIGKEQSRQKGCPQSEVKNHSQKRAKEKTAYNLCAAVMTGKDVWAGTRNKHARNFKTTELRHKRTIKTQTNGSKCKDSALNSIKCIFAQNWTQSRK
jgi:hypothetical protein